jgi:hypothetical protein
MVCDSSEGAGQVVRQTATHHKVQGVQVLQHKVVAAAVHKEKVAVADADSRRLQE